MSIDPLAEKYVHNSTYAFSENRVIDARELEGLEAEVLNMTILEVRKKVAAEGGDVEEYDKGAAKGGEMGIAVGTLFLPGPEDLVLGSAAIKFVGGLFKGNKVKKSVNAVNKLLKGSKKQKGKKGRFDISRKDGGMDKANKDFNDMKLDDVKDIKDADGNVIGRQGNLPDGKTVKVRSKSSDGTPTVEVGKINTKGKYRKENEIRYDE